MFLGSHDSWLQFRPHKVYFSEFNIKFLNDGQVTRLKKISWLTNSVFELQRLLIGLYKFFFSEITKSVRFILTSFIESKNKKWLFYQILCGIFQSALYLWGKKIQFIPKINKKNFIEGTKAIFCIFHIKRYIYQPNLLQSFWKLTG
jgi:hypothetical protein